MPIKTSFRRTVLFIILVMVVTTAVIGYAADQAPRVITPEELKGNIGASVRMPVATLHFANQEFETYDVAGQLFFSDKPESITGEGITYRGDVSGYARVYIYTRQR